MAQKLSPHYIEKKDFEEIYKVEDRHERPVFEEEKEKEERKEKILKQIQRRALPRMEETKLQTLDRKPSEVIGTLFDKVKFLRERINELESMINERVEIHKSIIKDIDEDINITNDMASHSMDMDERRNLKLDVSILRKEKRHESVQFWHDIVELRAELREIIEKFQMETEISNLFNDLRKDEAGEERAASAAEEESEGKEENIPAKKEAVRETNPKTGDHWGPVEEEEG